MSVAIKTAMIVAFVAIVVALVGPLIADLVPALEPATTAVSGYVVDLAPYLKQGRELVNLLLGNVYIVDAVIFLDLMAWVAFKIAEHTAKAGATVIKYS